MKNLLLLLAVLTGIALISCSTGDNTQMYDITVSVSPSNAGTISPSADSSYEEGKQLILQANTIEGYTFLNWSGDLDETANPLKITVDQDYSLTANFEIKSYELAISTEGEGSVSEEVVEQKSKDYEHGTVVELTANPAEGWKFVKWQGDITDIENPALITVDSPKEVIAIFEEKRTELKGIISSNTTLNSSDSPYQLTGKVQIAYGTQLKIEEGVEIYGEKQPNDESNVIEVFGNLLIEGINTSKVLLENVIIIPGDNSPEELYNIEMNYVDMIGGKLYPPTGGSIYGSITLTNSFLYEVNRSGFTETYMYIWYPQKDCYIEKNIFYNSGRIDTGHRIANVYVRNNFFFRDESLSDETGYGVENWASYNNSKTVIKNNTFANIEGVAVSLPSGYDDTSLDATENYWNSTSTEVIEDMIFDKNDDLSVAGEIPYDPFLDSPEDNTPVLPDSLK